MYYGSFDVVVISKTRKDFIVISDTPTMLMLLYLGIGVVGVGVAIIIFLDRPRKKE